MSTLTLCLWMLSPLLAAAVRKAWLCICAMSPLFRQHSSALTGRLHGASTSG